ncbi:dipeptide-binding protein DppE [Arthrobacter sp. Hiyo1]|uniref:ABC transporter substrate-binding protein n=1 Tax=Arthrobacter sp. Hiyo1 TaxID=1588020 RepID=UPI0006A38C24|nr:ABC transporter substrate-binding protein [Arthrobacter sp. Hiyo1]GAP60753.1 dipeptide-binding protein DppE [Arthrobacter sp. Hiyo1]
MNHVRRRSTMTGALMLASALSLTGCFAGGSADASGGGGARIRLAMAIAPIGGLSPYSNDASDLSRWDTAESLTQLDTSGNPQPSLATSWKQIDDVTWEFTIRSGVTFQDGTKLDAKAVVNSLQKALDAKSRPIAFDGFNMKLSTPDDMTVRMVTASPDPILPARLSNPQLVILSAAAYKPDGTVSPVGTGTGAFKITNVGGKTTATLDRYDGYWGTKAKAAGIDVTFASDGTARAASLRSGSADIAESIPVSQIPLMDPKLLHQVNMPRTTSLYFNNSKGVFADPSMRAAARAALDVNAIVSGVYEGHGDAADGLFGPAIPWAKDLRGNTASSIAPGNPKGKQVTLATYTDRPELPEVAVLVQQQLEKAGFVVKQDIRQYSNLSKDALGGAFDMVIGSRSTVLDTGDPVGYLQGDYTCKGTGYILARLCNPQIDQAIANASALKLGADREKAIMGVEATLLQQDVLVPIVYEQALQGEASGVNGAVRDPFARLLINSDTTVVR